MTRVPTYFPRTAVSGIAVTLISSVACLANADSYRTWADVVDVEPVYTERIETTPVERCRTYRNAERVERDPYLRRSNYRRYHDDYEHNHDGSPWRGLIGGLIGGLVGNQFGGGNGKTALTIAGAIAGASIAKNTGRRHRNEPVTRCEVDYESHTVEELLGYDVTYRYQGREFTKRTSRHPGDRVRIDVDVTPIHTSG